MVALTTHSPFSTSSDEVQNQSAAGLKSGTTDGSSLHLTVVKRTALTEDVVLVELAGSAQTPLPTWSPGAHLSLSLAEGLTRQYSLCGDPAGDTYHIAVLREDAGRGGSLHVHRNLLPGTRVLATAPRNHFPLVKADHYRFVAAGIGITPLLPMIAAAEATQARWSLLYLGRARARMPFVEQLSAYGDKVSLWPKDERGRADLPALMAEVPAAAAVYACGPSTLLDAVQDLATTWPSDCLHLERFSAVPMDSAQDTGFRVVLASSGLELDVPADKSIAEVMEQAGVPGMLSCMEGTCGTCETRVLAGTPCHRDAVLTDDERDEGNTMMVCVSRARTPSLTLDA